MANSSLTTHSSNTLDTQIQGKTDIRQMTIAAMIARGFSVKYVAKKLKISESRIYHLLSEKDSLVNTEIHRILKELFAGNDRHLINLYNKALQKLDNMLSSYDEEKQCRAIDRIIKIYLSRSAKNAVTIQQYFGIQPQDEKDLIKDIDDLILKMRKERGLPWPPDNYLEDAISEVRKARGLPELQDNKDSSHSTPKPSTHSSPENSTPDNAPQDASSQHAPSQGTLSQEAPSPNPPSNHSSPESIDEFVKEIGFDESIK